MSEYETIRIDKDGPVDWLTLNRPESLNAINVPMVRELRDYFGGLAEDDSVRIVVMRGEGRASCRASPVPAPRQCRSRCRPCGP